MQRQFERNVKSLEKLFEFVRQFFAREAVDPSHQYAVSLAAEEIFTNMVKYTPDATGEILVQLDCNGEELLLRLTDFDVRPFDVTQVPEPAVNRPLEERRPGGLGLLLVRRLFDSVDYDHRDGHSTVTLRKRLQ